MDGDPDHGTTTSSSNADADADTFEEEGRIALSELAPAVNLELLVVENNGLAVIRNHPEMGRVTVATRSFEFDGDSSSSLLELVLREHPALICRANDYIDYMEQFLECPEEVQVGILDMFYQPLSSPMGKSLIEPAKLLYQLGALDDFHVLHQLLSIYATNAHQYRSDKSAMPILGSKIPHSCHPNLGYSSCKYDDGSISYHVIRRPIQEGEILSFSYLSDLYETPTPERRELLQSTKSFVCQCERCRGPDYCRVIKCPKCHIYLPCKYEDTTTTMASTDPVWECEDCGVLPNQLFLQVEGLLEKAVAVMERSFQLKLSFSQRPEYTPEAVQDLVKSCSQQLSPTHHLTIKSLRLLMQLSTTFAYNYSKRMVVRGLDINASPQVHSYFQISVVADFRLVAACECVAAGCTGCGPLVIVTTAISSNASASASSPPTPLAATKNRRMMAHDPLYDCATAMRHLCDNLLRLSVSHWPSYAVTFVERYLPLLQLKFGETAIQDIEERITLRWKDATCLECGTIWDGTMT